MDPFIAQVTLFAGNFTPRGWAECDGALLPVDQNQALFSLIGTTYGGDGRANFALPKLRPPDKGMRYLIAVAGVYPSRS